MSCEVRRKEKQGSDKKRKEMTRGEVRRRERSEIEVELAK